MRPGANEPGSPEGSSPCAPGPPRPQQRLLVLPRPAVLRGQLRQLHSQLLSFGLAPLLALLGGLREPPFGGDRLEDVWAIRESC